MRASMPVSAANTLQLEAMMNAEVPLLLIAGLGSSKTFTLVENIVFLLSKKGLTPETITLVTITDKVAQELSTCTSKHLNAAAELQRLSYIEAHQMWYQDRYEDVFNGR